MFLLRLALSLLLASPALPAAGQTGPQSDQEDKQDITVTGQRDAAGKPIPMSDWRVAETDHLVVFSKGDEKRLVQIARNLERLHFLLSVLLDRVDKPDETIKLKVTLIGDTADFNHLDLKSLRWQHGPFPRAFPDERYYDPRSDGAVLATTHATQEIVLEQGTDLASLSTLVADPDTGAVSQSMAGPSGTVANVRAGGVSFATAAEGRLYAGYAQHYLLTYFPAGYPRWYLEGFGEIFSTMVAGEAGVIEYGHPPPGFRQIMETYGRYPLQDVLSGRYLTDSRTRPAWTPYTAWALAHLLFFAEEWRAPFHNYLAAVARGASPEEAMTALGDVEKLRTQWAEYRGRKVPFERMTYPPGRVAEPIVRRLTRDQAEFVRGRLILGARLDIPPPPPAGSDAKTAERMTRARAKALAARESWLRDLREEAARAPSRPEAQLLLAEAECRSGNDAGCLAAADRALAVEPQNAGALAWRGMALLDQAVNGPASGRPARLREARAAIVRANRADTEGTLPLLAFYRSFADARQPASNAALAGLLKASDSVPASPATRLMLGEELARRRDAPAARAILAPVANGPFEAPEKPKAQALLKGLAE